MRVFQKGFNYSQDGRGNRLIYHLQGCNMHCPWCSNPEGMPPQGAMMIDRDWLTDSCCPKGAVKEKQLDRRICETCEELPCVTGMRQKGIRLSYLDHEVEDLVREAVQSRPMFFDGGGVTLTGGEISLQFAAVQELLRRLGEEGIHRTIESNGSHPKMTELLPLVDEWIMDLKHYDEEIHKEWIGVSNAQTICSIAAACEVHPDVLIRIPLIPGFNDRPGDSEKFTELLQRFAVKDTVRVELLTYHEFGKDKWGQCGFEYKMKPGRIQGETVKNMENMLRSAGLHVVRT
ncbi:MAG: radical SAM protein [Blautia sp.]|nr:radical SAM protein [Blautia sp.]